MQILQSIQSQLGLMTWPLAVMSFITLMILLERTLFLAFNTRTKSKNLLVQLRTLDLTDIQKTEALIEQLNEAKVTVFQGAGKLLSHRRFEKTLREETVSIWLQRKRQTYTSGLRILSIIGMIAPLVGLLGTVIGLIEMFKSLATTSGSIEPSQLADGLGLAMSTTAAGLLIALPAIMGAQLFHMWADNTLAKIEHALNHCNLFIEGITADLNSSKTRHKQATQDDSTSWKQPA